MHHSNIWRNLILLWTVVIPALLHRTLAIGLTADLIAGFGPPRASFGSPAKPHSAAANSPPCPNGSRARTI